ncbi:PH domain-containing protein [Kibdelosporangium aridum]|uniref:PH domain-containing protein n=1 Tax=Kibdelosporangium aridum TaxID=2030 RepID=A0A1Y5XK39_KIBAR|nr:PH domain-containing protein [Kibdelosporangium aridum]SMC96291.1 PH domain-containing protein [Kibdelosporangium aridum]
MTSPKARLVWSTPPLLVAVGWVATAGAATWALLNDDTAGRVLVGLAALVAALLALHGTLARPRLAADSNGLVLRRFASRRQWTWAEVNVRLVRTRRLGREVSTLELDAEDDLVVLGWLDLGVAPEDVADALRELRT